MRVKIVSLLIVGVFVTSLGLTGVTVAKGKGGNGKGRRHTHNQKHGRSQGKGYSRHPGVASGHHVSHKWNGNKHGGYGHLNISPSGVGFSYHGRQFGVHVGPLLGVPGYDYPPSYLYSDRAPIFVEHYDEPQPPREQLPTVIATEPAAAEYQLQAEEAFRTRRYVEALRLAEHAVVDDRQNGKLHLFVSQVLFAVGRYEGAAAAIRRGMSLLDEREWGFVVANYDRFYDNADYVEQMERLVAFSNKNPETAHAHLVRGYHYIFLGYPEAAREQLTTALELAPRDRAAERLLALLGESLPPPAPTAEFD